MFVVGVVVGVFCFFFKQKTAYELRISDWRSDVCSSDLHRCGRAAVRPAARRVPEPAEGLLIATRFVAVSFVPSVMLAAIQPLARPMPIGRASCRERVCQSV